MEGVGDDLMASNIDATKPAASSALSSAEMRTNFSHAKTEIEALQASTTSLGTDKVAKAGDTMTGDLFVNSATASTTTGTGALKVAGGVGIVGAMFLAGALNVTNATASTSTTTGALIVTGGIGVGATISVGVGSVGTPSILIGTAGIYGPVGGTIGMGNSGTQFAQFGATGSFVYGGAGISQGIEYTGTASAAGALGELTFRGRNDAAAAVQYARILAVSDVVTAGAHTGAVRHYVTIANASTEVLRVESAGIDIRGAARVLKVNGTQVVSALKTGWTTAWTGTATRTTVATYTAPTISAGYVAAEVQAIADGLQAVSRGFKALTDDLRSHGLIGA